MKTILPLILLLITQHGFTQNVLFKDSSYSTFNGDSASAQTTYHYYNKNCWLAADSSTATVKNYFYFPDGTIQTITLKSFDTIAHAYTPTYQLNYTYYSNGKLLTRTQLNWVPSSSSYQFAGEDSSIYNANNLLFRYYYFVADQVTIKRLYSAENFMYYNNGNVDSTATYYYISKSDTQHTSMKFKYYFFDSVSHNYSLGIYSYQPFGNLVGLDRTDFHHDSANYISIDTIYKENFGSDTTKSLRSDSVINEYAYNADGTLRYSNSHDQYLGYSYYTNVASYYAYAACSSVLAVTFSNLSVSPYNNNAVLSWQAGNQTNKTDFNIQRSTDGKNFITIGTVPSAESNVAAKYSFNDINALLLSYPKIYYRIAENDRSGSVILSNVVTINPVLNNHLFHISPNPVSEFINIYTSSDIKNAIIKISNTNGKILFTTKQNISAGERLPINVSSYAEGIYFITLTSNSGNQQLKILKE